MSDQYFYGGDRRNNGSISDKTEMEAEMGVAKIGDAAEKYIVEISSTQHVQLLLQAIN